MEELPLTFRQVREISHGVATTLGLAEMFRGCEDSAGAFGPRLH